MCKWPARARAQGSGPDVPLSPETLQMIRERGLGKEKGSGVFSRR